MGPVATLILMMGCASWQQPEASPAPFIRDERPSKVKLFLAGGDSLVVWQPVIRNDSLVGLLPNSAPAGETLRSYARPLGEIDSLKVRRASGSKTAVVFGGPILLVVWGILLVGF